MSLHGHRVAYGGDVPRQEAGLPPYEVRLHPLAAPQGTAAVGGLPACERCVWLADCIVSVVRLGPMLRPECEAACGTRAYQRADSRREEIIMQLLSEHDRLSVFEMADLSGESAGLLRDTLRGLKRRGVIVEVARVHKLNRWHKVWSLVT
jgi:hypothetical protein